jgi:hypothetical protein
MGLLDWLRRSRGDAQVERWRENWTAAATQPSPEQVRRLAEQLQELGLSEDDLEIEREMLEALERVVTLASDVEAHGLPALATGHRIAGSDLCHFSAPASMPDEAGQPSGRLLLTSARMAFAGGAGSRTIPWHAVAEVIHHERDLVLIRADRETAYRFRCNTYGDAVCAAFIARQLYRRKRERPGTGKGGTLGAFYFSLALVLCVSVSVLSVSASAVCVSLFSRFLLCPFLL